MENGAPSQTRRSVRPRPGLFEHGKITDCAGFPQHIVGKRHIRGRQRFPVRKIRVVPDGNRPFHPVFGYLHLRRQIVADCQILLRNRQRALNQRLMNVLSRAPAVCRIKAGVRLRGRRHDHDDRRFLPCAGRFLLRRAASCPRFIAPIPAAAGQRGQKQQAGRRDCRPAAAKYPSVRPLFSFCSHPVPLLRFSFHTTENAGKASVLLDDPRLPGILLS